MFGVVSTELVKTEIEENGKTFIDEFFGDRLENKEFDNLSEAKSYYNDFKSDKHCLVSLFDYSKSENNCELAYKVM